ncbi:hypothetical protein QUF74_05710 [Candidatus Halobeggiatoa sp. HSG11]|nr:hypothetical protein [Candidatus Halobeggiatoa sp. HSG11]
MSKYYDTITELEKNQTNREYIVGWMGGYLQNPAREEQRINEAYEAGYEDGGNGTTDSASNWVS